MTCNDISSFISDARDLLDGSEEESLAERIARRWSNDTLTSFLCAHDRQAVCLAARCLGIVGDWRECELLTVQLDADEPEIVASAENALCMIWTRAASSEAIQRLHDASRLLDDGLLQDAVAALGRLVADYPRYAEAHHQLAITHHSLEHLDAAEHQYRLTVALNPYHYLAHAAMGHIAIERDRYAEAHGHYRRALEIHPRLAEICDILPELEGALARRVVA